MSEEVRRGPDGTIGPAGGGQSVPGVVPGPGPAGASGWPPAVELAPARAAWQTRVGQVQAAHAVLASAHQAFTRAAAVFADVVAAERHAWAVYRDAAGY